MARGAAVNLAKALDFIHRDGKLVEDFAVMVDSFYSGEMQRRIKKHGRVTCGKNEAITIGPERIRRIVTQNFLPERVHHRCEAHRCAGMAGVCLLHSVDGKRADSVDGELRNIRLAGDCLAHDGSLGVRESCSRCKLDVAPLQPEAGYLTPK